MRIIKHTFFWFTLSAAFLAGISACAPSHRLPIVDGMEVAAMVNGEPISRKEYENEIMSLHSDMSGKEKPGHGNTGAKKIDYSGLLERLVNTRLIVQEARNIGINELPEVRELFDTNARQTLRIVLMKEHAKDARPDEAVVERLYKKAVEEWKLASVMFQKESDARSMEAQIRKGGSFDELADKAIAAGKAKGEKAEEYFKSGAIIPAVRETLSKMEVGSVSPVVPVPKGFALMKLEDIRYPDSPEKKEEARQQALQLKRSEVLHEFVDALKKKYVTIHKEVLDGLDYGATIAEFEKVMKDERVIAEIEGEAPITISELSDELKQKYFHGIEHAIGEKKLVEQKYQVLDEMLRKRVLMKEARIQDIENTDAYKESIKRYENAVVFGVFVKKVIEPEVKIMESEVKTYYQGHLSEFTSPEMMRLDSVVFTKRSDAEGAMKKLLAGDQLSWLKSHAEGQVEKDAKGLLAIDGKVVASQELPEDIRRALSGAGAGDFRIYESPEGHFYVLSVDTVYPPKTEDYLSVREGIARKLYDERVQKGVESWAEKLRAASDVGIYLTY